MAGPLLIFDTHPIQYRAPVFRAIAHRLPSFKVYFFNDQFDGRKWWFHEVGKIPPQKWEVSLRDGYPNEVIGTALRGTVKTYGVIRAILEHQRPAAVLIYGYYLPEHWQLRRLCGRLRIPLLFVGETFTSGGSAIRGLVKRPLRHLFFRGISRFVAIGKKTEAYYRALGIARDRTVSAKYCTDVSFFSLSPAEGAAARTAWRKELGIAENAFVPLFVGRLFERKRPEDMLALHRRLELRTPVHTVIVGNGPLEIPLRAAAASDDRLHFTGFQNQAQTRAAYYGSDLLVVPSEYETWGLVINEAFACGRPALVTETCGAADDLVLPEETGAVVPVGDLVRATGVIERLLAEPSTLARWGEEARRKVTSEYGIEQFAEAILKAFSDVGGLRDHDRERRAV